MILRATPRTMSIVPICSLMVGMAERDSLRPDGTLSIGSGESETRDNYISPILRFQVCVYVNYPGAELSITMGRTVKSFLPVRWFTRAAIISGSWRWELLPVTPSGPCMATLLTRTCTLSRKPILQTNPIGPVGHGKNGTSSDKPHLRNG